MRHPSMALAGVVGVPDATQGELIAAFVVAKPGQSVTAAELGTHCREMASRYKVPDFITLCGSLPVTATGVLETTNGAGHFQLESATLGGVPIPKLVLQQVLSYYSRTPSKSGGISLDDAFQLPSRIREIQLERGQAIIIQ